MKSPELGIHLFTKANGTDTSLKEMLQFIKSQIPGKSPQFAYVESETSLIPHLTLWENIQLISGGRSWQEFILSLEAEWLPMTKITNPHRLASEATHWERLTVSLIKASLSPATYLLIDMNEQLHAPLNVQIFKKMLLTIASNKTVFVATANQPIWLDATLRIISKEGFKFEIEDFAHPKIKPLQSA